MSFDALAWAGRCNPGSPSLKLVLLGLAECANRQSNMAWPSISALEEFTCLNRKTIITALDTLVTMGFTRECEEKQGRTRQIKVYELRLETVPKTEQSQKRNSSTFSAKQSQKRDTEPVRTSIPEANASGANSDKQFWDNATAYLNGKRSMIGKWCKEYGQPETAAAITAAQIERAVEPVAYIERTLRRAKADECEFIGPC